jgi:hypothetical protein
MKPIHHAMVSARLFGGTPEDYVALHNAFDMSKAALPDMRHRAALHSVDHGASVMRLIFPDRIGEASLSELCVQHVNDDQGFDVRLDTWLSECETPTFARIRRKPPEGLEGFLTEPEVAAAARWGGKPEDFAAICDYYRLSEKASDHPLAPAVSRNAFSIFFSEMAFGPMITVDTSRGSAKYVPVRDIGECLTLAAFGFIPTLGDVFKTMSRKDWMTGARVARSRKKRCSIAGRDDLFCEEMDGLDGCHSASVTRTEVASVLSD